MKLTNPEIIRLLDLISGMAQGPDSQSACQSIGAYCQMMKEQLLNQIIELKNPPQKGE